MGWFFTFGWSWLGTVNGLGFFYLLLKFDVVSFADGEESVWSLLLRVPPVRKLVWFFLLTVPPVRKLGLGFFLLPFPYGK